MRGRHGPVKWIKEMKWDLILTRLSPTSNTSMKLPTSANDLNILLVPGQDLRVRSNLRSLHSWLFPRTPGNHDLKCLPVYPIPEVKLHYCKLKCNTCRINLLHKTLSEFTKKGKTLFTRFSPLFSVECNVTLFHHKFTSMGWKNNVQLLINI